MEQQAALRDLFAKYLDNQCTPEELNRLLQYFGQPDNEATLRRLVQEEMERPVVEQEQWQPVLDEAYTNITRQIKGGSSFGRLRFLLVAAAASVVLAIGWYWMRTVSAPQKAKLQQVFTTKGQRLQHRLADGTLIWLAPGSRLQFPERFTGTQREVYLEGEAFFEVAHDRQHPFIVHAAQMQTRVLGTSFNIEAYADQDAATVTLVTGKVNVTNEQGRQVSLTPNEQVVYNKGTHEFTKEINTGAAQLIDRRQGLLTYKGSLLPAVLRDLEYNYNVSIIIPAAMQTCTYYGKLNTKQSLQQILQQVALTYNATVQQKANHWEILNGECQH